jgi:hypothetical protein
MTWNSHRKHERIHIAVPVRISGTDRKGASFDLEAWTLDVSATGACIHVPPTVDLPRWIHVVADDYQFQADADVEVLWERTFPQRAIGVRVVSGAKAATWQAR